MMEKEKRLAYFVGRFSMFFSIRGQAFRCNLMLKYYGVII